MPALYETDGSGKRTSKGTFVTLAVVCAALFVLWNRAAYGCSPLARSWQSAPFFAEAIRTFSTALPPPQRLALDRDHVQSQDARLGSLIHVRILELGDTYEKDSTYVRLTVQASSWVSSPLRIPFKRNTWVIPALHHSDYNISARLWSYNVSNVFNRTGWGLPDDPAESLPCYDEHIVGGEQTVRVRLPNGVHPTQGWLDKSIRKAGARVGLRELEMFGIGRGERCQTHLHSMRGEWRFGEGRRDPYLTDGTFYPYSGGKAIMSSMIDAVHPPVPMRRYVADGVRWIRLIGDSNTRMILKSGFDWDKLRIPAGHYHEELVEGGTFPCIWAFNSKNGKDEQFLCVMFDSIDRPFILSTEWFTSAEGNSDTIDAVLPRSLRQAFSRAYHDVELLNGPMRQRYDRKFSIRHDFDSFLAPWPHLRDLEAADHTFISFGSHNASATADNLLRKLDLVLERWPRRRKLSFMASQATNSARIPPHMVRNNPRIEHRNAALLKRLHELGYVQQNGRSGPGSDISWIDMFGTTTGILENSLDPVHFPKGLYALHARIVFEAALA